MDARIPIGEVNETLGADFEGETARPSAASCSVSWATYRRSGMRSASAATSLRVDDGDGPWVAQVVFRLADEEREGDPSLQ